MNQTDSSSQLCGLWKCLINIIGMFWNGRMNDDDGDAKETTMKNEWR